MIYYKEIKGAAAPETARQLEFTSEGLAMGSIPGWRMLLDPDHLIGTDSIRNRAIRGGVAVNNSAIPIGAFGNGGAAFEPVGGATVIAPVNTAVNPDSWSLFCILQYASSPFVQLLVSAVDTEAVGIPLQIGYSASGATLIIYGGAATSGAPQRLSTTVNLASTGSLSPQLFMFTFSTRDGLRIYRNGEVIASDPTDTHPLDVATGADEWQVLRRTRGLHGMMGLLDIDLGWAEHAPYRRRIEQFVKSKYDIAEIPE